MVGDTTGEASERHIDDKGGLERTIYRPGHSIHMMAHRHRFGIVLLSLQGRDGPPETRSF
jgi:hypothetical protein